jgi:hypothetical protein
MQTKATGTQIFTKTTTVSLLVFFSVVFSAGDFVFDETLKTKFFFSWFRKLAGKFSMWKRKIQRHFKNVCIGFLLFENWLKIMR